MKKLIPLTLLSLVWIAGSASESGPQPLTTINFRGEALPVYALTRPIYPMKSAAPHYPPKELASAIEGRALLILLVGTDGKVSEVEVVSSEPTAAFGDAARTAVRQWRFKPQSRDGQPTKFIAQQEVTFKQTSGWSTGRAVPYAGITMPMVPDRYPYFEGFGRNN